MSNRTSHAPQHVRVEGLDVRVLQRELDPPESDGTMVWRVTTMILVEARAGGTTGIGYTYCHPSIAGLIRDKLSEVVEGIDVMAVPAAWRRMIAAVRNMGRPGMASKAISAVDQALWDLKARLLDLPLATLLGPVRDRVPVYGSSGFTSLDLGDLQRDVADWTERGITRVKIKIGRWPDQDLARVRAAREVLGAGGELFVDANGAYTRKQALAMAEEMARYRVSWFEEPVSSEDLEGMRLLRDRAPAGMEISSGEYGWDMWYFRRMLEAGAVDVIQGDITRCQGVSGMLRLGVQSEAHNIPLSTHTAPAAHLHVAASLIALRHAEMFRDHVKLESEIFEGAPLPEDGSIAVDYGRPGNGLVLRERDIERFLI